MLSGRGSACPEWESAMPTHDFRKASGNPQPLSASIYGAQGRRLNRLSALPTPTPHSGNCISPSSLISWIIVFPGRVCGGAFFKKAASTAFPSGHCPRKLLWGGAIVFSATKNPEALIHGRRIRAASAAASGCRHCRPRRCDMRRIRLNLEYDGTAYAGW